MVKFINKKIFLILLIVLSTICLSACGSLSATIITNKDGSIQEQVTIRLNTEEVINAGYNIEQVKNDIYLNALSEANAIVNSYNSKLHSSFVFINSVANTNQFANGVEVVKNDWQDNVFTIGIKFRNEQCYKFYYNIEDNSSPDYIYETHFLYTKVYFEGYTMFTRHYDLYSRLYNYYSYVYPNLVQDENNQVLYVHVTEKHREHSNANYIVYEDGNYYHTWIIDQNNPNQKVTIYYNIANRSNFIWLTLIVIICVVLIVFSILIIINKITKNKKLVIKLLKKRKNLKEIN